MGNVYEGALVTIFPIVSRSSNEGFLSHSHENVVEIQFRSKIRSDIHGVFMLRHLPRFLYVHPRSIVLGVQDMETRIRA